MRKSDEAIASSASVVATAMAPVYSPHFTSATISDDIGKTVIYTIRFKPYINDLPNNFNYETGTDKLLACKRHAHVLLVVFVSSHDTNT